MNAPTPALLADTAAAKVTPAASSARFSLRARGALAPLEGALGLTLPGKIGQRGSAGDMEALCLGPDEWTLICPEASAEETAAACARVYDTLPHSLVEISGREVTLCIEGPRASELLTIGCARDIAALPPGEARRTVFDGVTVVLWRDAPERFRMDVWNSFAPHVFDILATGCRELAAEAV